MTGGGPGEQAKDDSKDELENFAKEQAEMAKQMAQHTGTMY